TKLEPGAAGGGMQARDRERAPRLHLAGDVSIIERALGLQGDIGGLRVALVALLERRLHGAQRSGVHWKPPFRTPEDKRQPRGKSTPVVRGRATENLASFVRRRASPPQPAAGGGAGLAVVGHHRAVERAVERGEHATFDEVEGGGLAVARARQIARDLLVDPARARRARRDAA